MLIWSKKVEGEGHENEYRNRELNYLCGEHVVSARHQCHVEGIDHLHALLLLQRVAVSRRFGQQTKAHPDPGLSAIKVQLTIASCLYLSFLTHNKVSCASGIRIYFGGISLYFKHSSLQLLYSKTASTIIIDGIRNEWKPFKEDSLLAKLFGAAS